jgi:DNA-binding NtrC family response regulator
MNSSEKEKNNRILIVDDEADVLDFLKIYLESQGWDITTVNSADKAFASVGERAFFLIITDIAMPDMDGYEFVAKLKEKNVPSEIALMTGFGYNPKHTLLKIYNTMHYPCLFKPFNRAKLLSSVKIAFDAYHRGLT